MSLRIVLAAALLLVAALANLLLGAPALASRDPERRWRFGFGPLGVALVARLACMAVGFTLSLACWTSSAP